MDPTSFADLLKEAVTTPGTIADAFHYFHGYSLGNQLLALGQCHARGLQPGPLATFPRWKALGRHVRRGEKALTLCMPLTVKRTVQTDEGDTEQEVFSRFIYRNRWFVLSQTEGPDVDPEPVPSWDYRTALYVLDVQEVRFDDVDGTCLGFARQRTIAINPINPLIHKTRFHELAHVLLGHTTEGEQTDAADTPRSLRECEAEAVALLCSAALGLPGAEESRGYIQHWWGAGNPIPERSAQRILKVADQILQAGRGAEGRS